MATMALTLLPTELLENIIVHTLPEGFESMALTCRTVYVLCVPFIKRHNILRSHFRNFNYYEENKGPSFTVKSSFDLIHRIAVEPVVARYMRHVDFEEDSRFPRRSLRELPADVHDGVAVALLADSTYLEQAGLDWKEYYAKIEEELQATTYNTKYSQHAAAFLLTLLPNIKTLKLPRYWKPVEVTDKLIDTVLTKAKQSHLSHDAPSLAQITRLEPSVALVPQDRFDLDWAIQFLALPHIRSFCGLSCVALGDDGHKSIASHNSDDVFGTTIEVVDLESCSIDEVAIADFLKHMVRLRTLRYSHLTRESRGSSQDWNICGFVTAIEQEVGSHLEELSISIRELRGFIAPGTTSMRGFQRLRKLEFPLHIALCNVAAGAAVFIGDMVPASVFQLALLSPGTDEHAKVLEEMFRHFAARKQDTLPALEEIQLSYPDGADDTYKERCARLLTETVKGGVILWLDPFSSHYSIMGCGGQ